MTPRSDLGSEGVGVVVQDVGVDGAFHLCRRVWLSADRAGCSDRDPLGFRSWNGARALVVVVVVGNDVGGLGFSGPLIQL